MNVTDSHGSRSVLFDTDKKIVKKSDIDSLARSIKTVLQTSSKLVVALNGQKNSDNQQTTIMSSLDALHKTLDEKRKDVISLGDKILRSSYKHADFKWDKLESLAKKIDSTNDDLKHAQVSFVKKNPLLAGLYNVRNQQEVKGFKLDQNESNQNKIEWVRFER
jgi:hypothetical protein